MDIQKENNLIQEAFEVEADEVGFCLDQKWGDYENPYENSDTALAFNLFKKGWQAAKAQAAPAKLVLELEKDRFKEYEFKALLRQSLRASKITKSKLNWVHVMSMLGTGSTVAHRICEALGVNPDGTEFKTQEPVK